MYIPLMDFSSWDLIYTTVSFSTSSTKIDIFLAHESLWWFPLSNVRKTKNALDSMLRSSITSVLIQLGTGSCRPQHRYLAALGKRAVRVANESTFYSREHIACIGELQCSTDAVHAGGSEEDVPVSFQLSWSVKFGRMSAVDRREEQ